MLVTRAYSFPHYNHTFSLKESTNQMLNNFFMFKKKCSLSRQNIIQQETTQRFAVESPLNNGLHLERIPENIMAGATHARASCLHSCFRRNKGYHFIFSTRRLPHCFAGIQMKCSTLAGFIFKLVSDTDTSP